MRGDRSDIVPATGRLFGRPFAWVLLALGLLLIPAVGYALRAQMTWEEIHPAVNAILNASSGVFLALGWAAIRRREVDLHRKCMLSAFALSTLFLISYLIRYWMSGAHPYPGEGWDKILYLTILLSHMVLAAALLPMALRTLFLAWRKRFASHRSIARVTWPIWMYVSVTGVVVYVMLYVLAGAG